MTAPPVSPPLQVVCWKCSDNKVALEYDGNRLNKVCKSCYSILSAQRGERPEGKRRQTLEVSVTPTWLKRSLLKAEEVFLTIQPFCLFNTTLSSQSGDCCIRSFLFYGDDPTTRQQLWCVLPRTEAPTLQLYAAQQVGRESGTHPDDSTPANVNLWPFPPRRQDAKPLSCVLLRGCEVDGCCQELQGLPCFRVKQPTSTHTFCCHGAELKRSWLAALKDAATGKITAHTLCDHPTSGSSCEMSSSGAEECVYTGSKEELI